VQKYTIGFNSNMYYLKFENRLQYMLGGGIKQKIRVFYEMSNKYSRLFNVDSLQL